MWLWRVPRAGIHKAECTILISPFHRLMPCYSLPAQRHGMSCSTPSWAHFISCRFWHPVRPSFRLFRSPPNVSNSSVNSRRKFAEVTRRRSSTVISAKLVDEVPPTASMAGGGFVQGIRRSIGLTSERVVSPLSGTRSFGPTTSRGSGSSMAPIGITLTRFVLQGTTLYIEVLTRFLTERLLRSRKR